MKKSLIILLCVVIFYILLQFLGRSFFQEHSFFNLLFGLIYLWIPGIVALVLSKREGTKFPIFAKPNRSFYLIPIYTFAIVVGVFLVSFLFGVDFVPNPAFQGESALKVIGLAVMFFFISYLFVVVLLTVLLLVPELYWRGYLWEKMKIRGPFKALWIVALIWSIWQLPMALFSVTPGFSMILLDFLFIFLINFILTPVLTYFRVKCKSVLAPAFFYSTLIAAFIYLIVLFPSDKTRDFAIYCSLILVGVIIFSLIFKLYFPSQWKKMTDKSMLKLFRKSS